MAFNLFKRKEKADIIFKNGTIYTMDEESPIVNSIACKNGVIIALGEEAVVEEYQGEHTQIVDLQNKFVLPGFIEANGHPVNKIFEDSYAKLDETMMPQDIISNIAAFQKSHPQNDYYLAYGYNESLIDQDMQAQLRDSMDKISDKKPIIAIASDGLNILLNSVSVEIIKAKAEEMEIPAITTAFAMGVLVSTDYEILIKNTFSEAYKASTGGYTCIFNMGSFPYFDNAYRDILIDIYQADMLKQRSFSSLLLNRQFSDRQVLHFMDQSHTACTELEGKINFDTLYIQYSGNQDKLNYMSSEYLSNICDKIADKGYNIRIAAFDKPAALDALNILGNLQPSYKKSAFSVEHNEELTDEDLSQIFTGIVHIHDKNNTEFNQQSTQNAIEERTIKAAEYLGLSNNCGSIEQGKWADFAVYSNDPTEIPSASDLEKLQADMTVLNGEIVYKKGEDAAENWAKKMTEHFNSVNEDFYL
jgi:predicted amidohydrolase YtcJ